jgi:hypothetical protein
MCKMQSLILFTSEQPTLTVPLGKYANGKPYGLTLVGKRCADHKLLQHSSMSVTSQDVFFHDLCDGNASWLMCRITWPKIYSETNQISLTDNFEHGASYQKFAVLL